MKIKYCIFGNYGRFPKEEELIKIFKKYGFGFHHYRDHMNDPDWPRVVVPYWNCIGPGWSHYKSEKLLPIDAVKFATDDTVDCILTEFLEIPDK